MTKLATLLHDATTDEPPLQVDLDRLVARGRWSRARRTALSTVAGVTVLGTASAGFVALRAESPPIRAQVVPAASASASAVPDGPVTKDNLAALVATVLGVELRDPQHVALGRPWSNRALELGANIDNGDSEGLGSLLVTLDGPRAYTYPPVSCAEMAALLSGDGYAGPCEVRVLANGDTLVHRSGRTASGGYTKVAANLIRPDGSGILAEATNQAALPRPAVITEPAQVPKQNPPVTRVLPPVSSRDLLRLVVELDRRGR